MDHVLQILPFPFPPFVRSLHHATNEPFSLHFHPLQLAQQFPAHFKIRLVSLHLAMTEIGTFRDLRANEGTQHSLQQTHRHRLHLFPRGMRNRVNHRNGDNHHVFETISLQATALHQPMQNHGKRLRKQKEQNSPRFRPLRKPAGIRLTRPKNR